MELSVLITALPTLAHCEDGLDREKNKWSRHSPKQSKRKLMLVVPVPRRATTDGIHNGLFKLHGRMQLEQSGQLNILEAHGPFNLDLVIAADKAQEDLYAARLY